MKALARLARLLATVAMLVALSGAVQVAQAIVGASDECAEECDGCLGTKSCPPNCAQGTCAKVFPSVVPAPFQAVVLTSFTRANFLLPAEPTVATAMGGIFHPPRV
jgi:hypothetical protein